MEKYIYLLENVVGYDGTYVQYTIMNFYRNGARINDQLTVHESINSVENYNFRTVLDSLDESLSYRWETTPGSHAIFSSPAEIGSFIARGRGDGSIHSAKEIRISSFLWDDTTPVPTKEDPRWVEIYHITDAEGVEYNTALANRPKHHVFNEALTSTIAIGSDTIYVPEIVYFDRNYVSIDSDGSYEKPYNDIDDAPGSHPTGTCYYLKGNADPENLYYNGGADMNRNYVFVGEGYGTRISGTLLFPSTSAAIQSTIFYRMHIVGYALHARSGAEQAPIFNTVLWETAYGYLVYPGSDYLEVNDSIVISTTSYAPMEAKGHVRNSILLGTCTDRIGAYLKPILENTWIEDVYVAGPVLGHNTNISGLHPDTGEGYSAYRGRYLTTEGHMLSSYIATVGFDRLYEGKYVWGIQALLNAIRLYLLRNSLNEHYGWNAGQLSLVSNGDPTQADFLASGSSNLKGLTLADITTIEGDGVLDVVTYFEGKASGDAITSNHVGSPLPAIAIQNSPIKLDGFDSLLSLTATGNVTSNLRFMLSTDGLDFKSYEGIAWVSYGALSTDATSIATVQTSGMTMEGMNALTEAQLNELIGTSKQLRVAVSLKDTGALDQLDLTVNGVGDWVKDEVSEINLRGSELSFKPNTTATYKVNFQDE